MLDSLHNVNANIHKPFYKLLSELEFAAEIIRRMCSLLKVSPWTTSGTIILAGKSVLCT